mgnify:CR=1 FL=1
MNSEESRTGRPSEIVLNAIQEISKENPAYGSLRIRRMLLGDPTLEGHVIPDQGAIEGIIQESRVDQVVSAHAKAAGDSSNNSTDRGPELEQCYRILYSSDLTDYPLPEEIPWIKARDLKPKNSMEQLAKRMSFIKLLTDNNISLSDASRLFGIRYSTGSKWWLKYKAGGILALLDQRQVQSYKRKLSGKVLETRVAKMVEENPDWDYRKIYASLKSDPWRFGEMPHLEWVREFVRKQKGADQQDVTADAHRITEDVFQKAKHPNDLWVLMVYKRFKVDSGSSHQIMLVQDYFSSFVLAAYAFETADFENVRSKLAEIADRFGVPKHITTTSGWYLARRGQACDLTIVSEMLAGNNVGYSIVKLNMCYSGNKTIRRMYRALDNIRECAKKASYNIEVALEQWRKYANESPLHLVPLVLRPVDLYRPSDRKWLDEPVQQYGDEYQTCVVDCGGCIQVGGVSRHVSPVLAGKSVGLRRSGERKTEVYYGKLLIGVLDNTRGTPIEPVPPAGQ